MHPSLLVPGLLIWLALPRGQEEPVVRVYDVSSLLQTRTSTVEAASPIVVPVSSRPGFNSEQVEFPALSRSELQGVIQQIVTPESWESPEALISFLEGDSSFLLIRATPAVNLETERFLRWLESTLLGSERLRVRIWQASHPPSSPSYCSPSEIVAYRVAAGIDAAARPRHEAILSLGDGRIRGLRVGATAPLISDWEVEIAQGSVVWDPVLAVTGDALQFIARAVPCELGSIVDLVMIESLTAGPPRSFTIEARTLHTGRDFEPDSYDKSEILLEFSQIATTSLFGSYLIPDGKTLMIPIRSRSAVGDAQQIVELEIVGSRRPARSTFEVPVQTAGARDRSTSADIRNVALKTMLAHVDALLGEGLEIRGTEPEELTGVPGTLGVDPFFSYSLAGRGGRFSASDLADSLRSVLEPLDPDSLGNVELLSDRYLLIQVPEIALSTLTSTLDRLAACTCACNLTGRARSSDGAIVAEFGIPLLSGRPQAVWSGLQTSALVDWDVDVANEAAIGNPDTGLLYDGYALRFELSATSSGRQFLDVQGELRSLSGPPERVSLANPFTPFIERVTARSIYVHDRVEIEPVDGMFRCSWAGDGLTLELEVQSQ